ncbi:GNAT family N-acetyltransferase [Trinickia caryophylli]|uniref:Protein N-acetyltransferase, RimJ/RimL family n=1 Tax=Trinickia caryophylli TaxID=28094 RepID=A0A1X7G9Z1_TRICW|nr:GNAT family N-acetyltransferase [Trinickia caryophylli]PMS11368.1 N-acetyltransferase [Trinickia caryophylli]TRX17562.1 GNAT family N-acetyltransferase [Trinickia caryophylli]WQE11688.1 GNAT family N-acetyltransferase [Trinickia caryophylli]SMF66485.1 Protein N-acetyltransferase, RimJ/RimL family [Trinickia caryophylli]GLU34874.1 N-acetyltransferase [Trinickia caryophylli]
MLDPAQSLPALDTPRLLIRQRTLADLDACLEMDRDPDVTRHVAGPWRDPVAHRRFVVHRITRPYPPGLGYWSIRERTAPERFVGWVLLIPDHGTGPDVEIGWRLVREAWGRGIATEAATALVAHAFETLRLPRVIADIAAANAASLHVAQKLGMHRVGYDDTDGMRYERYRLERADLRARR